MKRKVQRHPWKQDQLQTTMDNDKYIISEPKSKKSSTLKYLVESFTLNSVTRVVERKHKNRRPDPLFAKNLCSQVISLSQPSVTSGRKVRSIDLTLLDQHFANYVKTVNLILERIYRTPKRAQALGRKLAEYRGYGYTLLRKERDLAYQHNDEFKELVFERMHRNALEHAARTVLSDYTRRELIGTAIGILSGSTEAMSRLLKNRYIPRSLIKQVRAACSAVKSNSKGYAYTVGVLKQIRRELDLTILRELGERARWRGRQRAKVREALSTTSKDKPVILSLLEKTFNEWLTNGYPFSVPKLRTTTEDFAASTENAPGQGYWYSVDKEKPNEILFFLKAPPGVNGTQQDNSPYRTQTLAFRFLNWFPRAVEKAQRKAEQAALKGDTHRARRQLFRARVFQDMNTQLRNTIALQRSTHKLSRLKQRKSRSEKETGKLKAEVYDLRGSRRCAPPRLLVTGQRVTLQVPFLPPNEEMLNDVIGDQTYDTLAGADRGIRVPMALSVLNEGQYEDRLVSFNHLVDKRERLRKQAYALKSQIDRKRNNWEKKRKGLLPTVVLRKQRHLDALWRKVRRLDREIARQVASETVWWCEQHNVRTLYFEDLRNYQAPGGRSDLSWALSTNLWGKIFDTVRYMREALGHRYGGIWSVNPFHTSKRCHVCGEMGIRVKSASSTTKRKGGEYFYCSHCQTHMHADLNAARNIIHVQSRSSVVPGRTNVACPSLSK